MINLCFLSIMKGMGIREWKRVPYVIPIQIIGTFGACMMFPVGIHALLAPSVYISHAIRPNFATPMDAFIGRCAKFRRTRDDFTCQAPNYWPEPDEGIENPYEELWTCIKR